MNYVIKKRNDAIQWARGVLEHKDEYVIFDTETTGLKETDVIVHFAVMDLDGNMLIDTLVKPMSKRRMSKDAEYIHGITMKDLKDAPFFEEVVELFRPIVARKKVLSYNARFHAEMFEQTYYNEGVSGEPIRMDCWDIKDYYIKFSDAYNPALPGRKNTGQGDCAAVLALLMRMANSAPEADTAGSSLAANRRWWLLFVGPLLIIVGVIILLAKMPTVGILIMLVGLVFFIKNEKKK